MDIVIPYKKDKHNGLELMYALRSIEKYLTGWDDIVIVGDRPTWITNQIWINASDHDRRKQFSIKEKLIKGTYEREEFIYWNDDHFLLKPLDVQEFEYWYAGDLKEVVHKARGGYYSVMFDTIKELERRGATTFHYDIHVPIKMKNYFLSNLTYQTELCLKSMYCNLLNLTPTYMQDCKIDFPLSVNTIKQRIKDRLFFSIGETGMQPDMLEVLNELYPTKSKFEL